MTCTLLTDESLILSFECQKIIAQGCGETIALGKGMEEHVLSGFSCSSGDRFEWISILATVASGRVTSRRRVSPARGDVSGTFCFQPLADEASQNLGFYPYPKSALDAQNPSRCLSHSL